MCKTQTQTTRTLKAPSLNISLWFSLLFSACFFALSLLRILSDYICVFCVFGKRICFCTLGFPRSAQDTKARSRFLNEIVLVEEFVRDPWRRKARVSKGNNDDTVQVAVPEVVLPPPPPAVVVVVAADGGGGIGGGCCGGATDVAAEAATAANAQTKRVVLQRKVAAEDYARRFEPGDIAVTSKDLAGEDGQSNMNVVSRRHLL